MTYPDRAVQRFLDDHFVFHQIDTSRRDDALRPLYREIKPFWAPLFRATSSRGIELRRWFGFATPDELIAELELALVRNLMLERKEPDAVTRLHAMLERLPESPAAPEATFWLGVAEFKAGGRDFDQLTQRWNALMERWPASPWARRADVLEMRDHLGSEA